MNLTCNVVASALITVNPIAVFDCWQTQAPIKPPLSDEPAESVRAKPPKVPSTPLTVMSPSDIGTKVLSGSTARSVWYISASIPSGVAVSLCIQKTMLLVPLYANDKSPWFVFADVSVHPTAFIGISLSSRKVKP